MKVQNINSENNNKLHNAKMQQPNYNPSFKGVSALSGLGNLMQGIENGGFLVTFLIQDGIGMTAPRTAAAFLRDREVTGNFNVQEGFEVLGREGLTGPCMMAVAPIMFALAAKFGRSTSTNSQLIRRFGDSLKEMLSDPKFDKELLSKAKDFKKEFYTKNIREMLTNTIGKDNVTEEAITYILERITKFSEIPKDAVLPKNKLGIKSKGKYKDSLMNEIVDYVNSLKYSTSSDLTMLDKFNVGSKSNSIKSFSIKNALEGMVKYGDDAITLNKNLAQLNEAQAESLKNTSIAKRFITNIATMAATLGVLSLLPKIYMRNSISPGARTAMQLKEAKEAEKAQKEVENSNEVSFKGKAPNKSFLTKLGEWLSKVTEKDFFAKELEYNGHNFTNSLMAGLSVFGLLTPRGLKAYNRAQVKEDGKKDLTELYEILIRDLTSSLLVVFAVPMLTRAAVTAYENKSGFVLMHKDRTKNTKETILDLFNPYSKAHVLKNTEINSLYNGIDSQVKMNNFCEYIEKNGGDLHKILSKSEAYETILKEGGLNATEIASLTKEQRNAKLKDFFKNIKEKGNFKDKAAKAIDENITKLMKGSSLNPKANKILSFARGLNSLPGFIATFLISPYLLGWAIPRLTYANTRRIHAKEEMAKEEKASKINTAA